MRVFLGCDRAGCDCVDVGRMRTDWMGCVAYEDDATFEPIRDGVVYVQGPAFDVG